MKKIQIVWDWILGKFNLKKVLKSLEDRLEQLESSFMDKEKELIRTKKNLIKAASFVEKNNSEYEYEILRLKEKLKISLNKNTLQEIKILKLETLLEE